MARNGSSGGLSTLLGLLAVGLIIAGIVYSVSNSDDESTKKSDTTPKVIQKQPTKPTQQDIIKSLNLGDGKLGSSTVKASDLGKTTKVSGGVSLGGGGGGSSSRRSSGGSGGSRRRSGG